MYLRRRENIAQRPRSQTPEATCLSAELRDVAECWEVIKNELNQFQRTAVALGNNVDETSTKLLHRAGIRVNACYTTVCSGISEC